jgi:uncharacterized membrane protein YbhN (UPF0104 family)
VAAVLSWVVGFVLVPVPGGVGVREAAFVAAAGSLDPGIAAATAVAARVLFIGVDAFGAAIGSIALRGSSHWEESHAGDEEEPGVRIDGPPPSSTGTGSAQHPA